MNTTKPQTKQTSVFGKIMLTLKKINSYAKQHKSIVFTFIILLYGALFVSAVTQFPDGMFDNVNYPIIGIVVATAILPFLVAASEYKLQASMVGIETDILTGLRYAVIGRAANLLPLPGGVVVKAASLVSQGASPKQTGLASLSLGIGWLFSATLITGTVIVVGFQEWLYGAGFLVASAVFLAITYVLVRKFNNPRKLIVKIMATELACSMVASLRLGLLFMAITEFSFLQGTTLGAASALASSASFIPSGLGIQETIAGLIGKTVGVPFAAGVLTSALLRCINLAFTALLALALRFQRNGDKVSS